MAILPNELLSVVCSHADNATLKQLRLVHRTLNTFAAKFLFEEIDLILLPKSIKKVRKIMEHPTLHRHVESMVYFGQRLNQKFDDYETWKASATVSNSNSKVGWRRFCRLLREQSSLISQGAEFNIFRRALRNLPNLVSIKLSDLDMIEEDGSPCYSIARRCQLEVADAFACSSDVDFDRVNSPHVTLLHALRSPGKQIQELELADVPGVAPFYRAIRPYAISLFSSLRDLSFEFWIYKDNMPKLECSLGKVSSMCEMLSFAPLLEQLSLHPYQSDGNMSAYGHISEEEPHTDVTDIFSTMTWPNLEDLEMDDCSIDTSAFIGFMERHSATLTILNLDNVKLVDPPLVVNGGATKSRQSGQDQVYNQESPWERAIEQLAPVMHFDCLILDKATDDELAKRIRQGNKNGIGVECLVGSWRTELNIYFRSWNSEVHEKSYFPVYGEPRPTTITYMDVDEDDL